MSKKLSEAEKAALERKNKLYELCIVELELPLEAEGKTFGAIKKVHDLKPVHRIRAVKYSEDTFGTTQGDGIVCSSISQLFVFGNVEGDQFSGDQRLSADFISEEMDYNDFFVTGNLLGKRVP